VVSAQRDTSNNKGVNVTSKLKTIMVGCGGISRAWLDAIKDIQSIEMVGFVDLDKSAAQDKATAYHWDDAIVTDDFSFALSQTSPDMVFNCTVPEAHYPITLQALAHNCHVLGEKPLADTLEHARKMIDAANIAQKIFAVIQNRRYMPGIRRLREFIKSGALGRITTIDSDFYIGAHFGGFRDHMAHVLLVDMAIHTFDMARMISGADATSVYCHEWNPPGSWYDQDASAIAVFTMTDDIVYTYRGSWCAEGLNTSWQGTWRIIGENGTLTWDGEDSFNVQIVAKKGSFFSEWTAIDVPEYTMDLQHSGHAGLIREFVNCINTGSSPETICTDNIRSLAMVLNSVASAEAGHPVQIAL
jgi:predicted dehydrogenase